MKAEIKIPDNLNEITLLDYMRYLKIENPTAVDILATFLHMSENIITRMKKTQVESIANHIVNLFNEKPDLTTKFNYNGKKYGFITNLDEISWGENADITKYIGEWDKMHLAMSVLYRPITNEYKEKYLIEQYDGVKEGMEMMPLGVVLGSIVFFYHLTNDLLNYIPNYLAQLLVKESKRSQADLVKSGDSTTNYIQSVKETLLNLKKLPNFQYTNVIYTSHLNQTKHRKRSGK